MDSTTQLLPLERDETTGDGRLAGCVTVRLEQRGGGASSVVVLNLELIQRLEATLREVARDPKATCLVLASASERVFVAGADLKTILEQGDEELDRYLAYGQQVFGMLADLPFPTVAAINGAALGGGLEVAMHCDGLVAAPSASGKPYPVGLPEAGLSICPGWGGTNLLPARIDPAEAIRRTAAGTTMTFDEAVAAGMFDAVAPDAAGLIATAKAWLGERIRQGAVRRDGAPSRWIGRPESMAGVAAALAAVENDLPKTQSAAAVLSAVRAGLNEGWRAALDVERRELVRLRSTPEGKGAIRAFFDRSAGKK